MVDLAYWMPTITPIANAYGFDPRLVAAVVWTESRGKADAFRHEPKFWTRYMAGKAEFAQCHPRRHSSSYGLMQPMWVVAKEMGFTGEPELLFVPQTNLHYGCKILQDRRQWAANFHVPPERQRLAMLAAYNGGKGGNAPTSQLRPENQQYAERVLAAYRELTAPPAVSPSA